MELTEVSRNNSQDNLTHWLISTQVDVERVKRLKRAEAKGAGLVTSFRNAHAPQIMIHGSKPISATIGNYNAVYRVLKGTPHEWMLERHLEPKQS